MKKQKKTLAEQLAARKTRKPPALIYLILAFIWKCLYFRRLGVHITKKVDPKSYKGPYIVVSNHASRMDYIYTGLAFLPHRLNFVAGYNEFFRSHLAFVFRLLQVIPKRNFTPDLHTVKEIMRIIRAGGRIILFPEGMSSIGGNSQPCAIGGGKLLKKLGVPVLVCRIRGGYLTNTKYCLDERRGRVEVEVDELFSPDKLASMTADEIQSALDAEIRNDDYAWNKTARVAYEGHGRMALDLHTLLFKCPRCGEELRMKGEGDVIRCEACGNGATMNAYYDLIPLDDTCVLPETPSAWWNWQREQVRARVADPAFELREKVKLGTLPKYEYLKDQKTSEITGEGEIVLDRDGFTFTGKNHGEDFTFHLAPGELPTYGMCTDVTRFYTFFRGEFYEFFPEKNTVALWLMATEEIHRLTGGAWQDYPKAE